MSDTGISHKSTTGLSIKASRFTAFIGMVCLAGIIAFAGCDSRSIAERVTTVDFIICKAATSEQTIDVEILLRPQDDKGHTIKASGTLGASLWTQNSETNKKEELIHEWIGIEVIPESYEPNEGALLCFQHSIGYGRHTSFYQPAILGIGFTQYYEPSYIIAHIQPSIIEKAYSGYDVVWVIMEVAFTLDGKTLVCTKKGLDIGLMIDDKW